MHNLDDCERSWFCLFQCTGLMAAEMNLLSGLESPAEAAVSLYLLMD